MTHITLFIALVILTSQGRVHYDRITEEGVVEKVQGVPPRMIEAMIAADFNVPQEDLNFSEDLIKDLDEITEVNIDPYFNDKDEYDICPIDRYRID